MMKQAAPSFTGFGTMPNLIPKATQTPNVGNPTGIAVPPTALEHEATHQPQQTGPELSPAAAPAPAPKLSPYPRIDPQVMGERFPQGMGPQPQQDAPRPAAEAMSEEEAMLEWKRQLGVPGTETISYREKYPLSGPPREPYTGEMPTSPPPGATGPGGWDWGTVRGVRGQPVWFSDRKGAEQRMWDSLNPMRPILRNIISPPDAGSGFITPAPKIYDDGYPGRYNPYTLNPDGSKNYLKP